VEASASEGGSELEESSKFCGVPVGGVLIDGDHADGEGVGEVGLIEWAALGRVMDDTVGS
jgi:hypothetical protein